MTKDDPVYKKMNEILNNLQTELEPQWEEEKKKRAEMVKGSIGEFIAMLEDNVDRSTLRRCYSKSDISMMEKYIAENNIIINYKN